MEQDRSVSIKNPSWYMHKLHEDEQFLASFRKNDMTFAPTVIEVLILIFIPWYFGVKYNFIFSSNLHSNLMLVWILLVAIFACRRFYTWYMDYYMLTSKRLLHIYHPGLFKKHVDETYLDKILNVNFKTTGFISTLFEYGDVSVKAAGMEDQMIIKSVSNPENVKDDIWNMHLKIGGASNTDVSAPDKDSNNKIDNQESRE
jgi:uncharacterized membrane protein YdbT with pleckstrin-like domain